jgi:hypothetical protein
MSGIFNTLTSVFTGIGDEQTKFKKNKETLQRFIKATDKRFNEVIKLLINNYLANDKFMAFQLLDSITCSKTAVYLSETLQKQLDTINFKGTEILFQKKKYTCDTYNSCEKLMREIKFKTTNDELTNKKQLCDKITIFHIRIMNLVAALLVQLDPNNNIAIQRMNILYNSINDDEIQVSLCTKTEQELITGYGLNELMNLYLYNLLLSSNDFTETSKLVAEYNNLANILKENLANDVSQVLADDIRIITDDIKQALVQFHNQFRSTIPNTEDNAESEDNNETNKANTNKTTNNSNKDSRDYENNSNNNDTYKGNKNETIKQQEEEIKELKSELEKLQEQLSGDKELSDTRIKDLEDKLSDITEKYILLEEKTEQSKEDNTEVNALKAEILELISQISSNSKMNNRTQTTKYKQSGGNELAQTAQRFRDFMKRFSVVKSDDVSNIQNKFFKLFDTDLRIPSTVADICSRELDENKIITINYTEADAQINNYLQIYNDMTTYYMNTIKEIIRILEKEILEIEYNDAKLAVNVKIRQFSEEALNKKETEIRKLIAEYINRIHEYYINGINELSQFLGSK